MIVSTTAGVGGYEESEQGSTEASPSWPGSSQTPDDAGPYGTNARSMGTQHVAARASSTYGPEPRTSCASIAPQSAAEIPRRTMAFPCEDDTWHPSGRRGGGEGGGSTDRDAPVAQAARSRQADGRYRLLDRRRGRTAAAAVPGPTLTPVVGCSAPHWLAAVLLLAVKSTGAARSFILGVPDRGSQGSGRCDEAAGVTGRGALRARHPLAGPSVSDSDAESCEGRFGMVLPRPRRRPRAATSVCRRWDPALDAGAEEEVNDPGGARRCDRARDPAGFSLVIGGDGVMGFLRLALGSSRRESCRGFRRCGRLSVVQWVW